MIVDIFSTQAILALDFVRFEKTKPMYAALKPGDDKYFCFTEKIYHLAEEIATKHDRDLIFPRNLRQEEYWKKLPFGNSTQSLVVLHRPLTVDEMAEFFSGAIS